jgi:two-component system NarL family sensor kinase
MQIESDRQDRGRNGPMLVALHVGQFAFAGIVAAVIVGLATAVASRRVGEREGISEARVTTLIKAEGVVEPVLTDSLLGDAGGPTVARLQAVVKREVIDNSLVRIKLWSKGGTILYSDEPRLIGRQFNLGPDELNALGTGRIFAEVSDLQEPRNVYEREIGSKLLSVYLPVHTPNGEPLLFEAYFRYNSVQASGTRLWRSFAPISLGALVMLEMVQIPLAWSLARRLRKRLQERESLIQRALDASEVERRQIASDLHDGVVQDLAGVAYALSARARRTSPADGIDDAEWREESQEIAETVQESIRSLRSLVIDLYPPNLREEGLASALRDLVERARDNGLNAELDTSSLHDPLPDAVAGLLYRSAQEGLRNALQHADATSITVRVRTANGNVVLEVVDDGRGFDDATLAAREANGHVGLKALRGLVGDGGGSLRVRSTPGSNAVEDRGTTMTVEIPLP